MQYTFENDGKMKTVEIDDEWIAKTKTSLDLSTQEAIDLWLFDHDYTDSPEADELTKKAAVNGIKHDVIRKKRKAPTRKPDEVKRELILYLAECLQELETLNIENVERLKIEREIGFTIGSDSYSLILTKHRNK